MDVFKTYAVDEAREEAGAWMELGDAELLIARGNNPRFTRLFTRLVKQHKRILDSQTEEADKLAQRLHVQALAETVLLGWKNLQYQGEEITYSHENAIKLLNHKEFYAQVIRLSDDLEAFKLYQDKELEKN